jgi:Sulfotransferase family
MPADPVADAPAERDPARLVFVAGLHRSGTTPVARAIEQHPSCSGLTGTGAWEDEGQHRQPVYPKAKVYGGAGRFARDERSHLTESSELVTPENAAALWSAWEPYWDLSRRFLVEKSPPNLVMGRFLQALFPGSAYVVVMRHPVIVALGTRKWRKLVSRHWENYTTIESMVEHWLIAHRIMRADLPHLDRYVVLRYEDLVDDPEGELGKVGDLLGLEQPIPAATIAGRSEAYEAEWARMAAGNVFERRTVRRVQDRFGAEIEAFGYRCDDLRYRSSDWQSSLS